MGMVGRYSQSLKHEEIWLNEYDDPIQARRRLKRIVSITLTTGHIKR